MRILAFDTATSACTVAIGTQESIDAEESVVAPRKHMEKLLPLIDEVLTESSVLIENVEGIAVGVGPGSFTGIRIAVSIAQGLALGLEVPLIGVSTLDVLAYGCSIKEGLVSPVIDAKRGEVYFAVYKKSGGNLKRLSPYKALEPKDFCQEIEALKRPVTVLGDAFYVYGDVLRKELTSKSVVDPGENWYPKGYNILPLAFARIEGEKGQEISQVLPIYVRKPIAEENFKA